jgi:hypothetical protein
LISGVSAHFAVEVVAATARIRELGTELAILSRVTELLKEKFDANRTCG